jgi:hydrogenase small subunit
VGVGELVRNKPVVNVPGCPPIPVVMTAVLAHYITFGTLPELDRLGRPRAFYGETLHDRCYRRPFYDQGKFAKRFDDAGARQGWCLFELGCKGPVTRNACAHVKWNDATSWPVETGHGCIGCSEPGFWDAGGFYRALSLPAAPLKLASGAVAAGTVVGVAMTIANWSRRKGARQAHETATLADLEKAK